MQGEFPDVRVVAAEALSYLGEVDLAIETLESAIKGTEEYEILAALNALDFMYQAGHVSIDRIRALIKGISFEPTPNRMAEYFKSIRESPARLPALHKST